MNSQWRLLVNSVLVCMSVPTVLVGCNATFGPSLRGSGTSKTEPRAVAPFSEIEVGSAIRLTATVGPASDLVVTTDDNILAHVKTEVIGDRLKIFIDSSYSSDLGINVEATAPALRALSGSGASQITISGISGDLFELELSGASNCHLTGDADLMDVSLSGASQSKIVGKAAQVDIDCSGASRLDATELLAEKVVADLSGASVAHVNATAALTADASGASKLNYAGQPARIETSTSGASSIAAAIPMPSTSLSEAELQTDSPSDD